MIKNYLLLFALLLATVLVHSQVTIGSAEKPVAGALLDLKDAGTYSNGETASKGLGMPRVELTNLEPTSNGDLAKSIGNTTGSYDMAEHIGLIVYNVKEGDVCDPGAPNAGLHVWDGNKWQKLSIQADALAPGVYKVTDSRDGEVYLARNFGATAGDWMLENLRYDPIAHPAAGFTDYVHTATTATAPSPYTAKYYAYAEGDENPYNPANHPSAAWASKKKNGLLYNWAAATNGENTAAVDQGEGNGSANPIPGNVQQVGVQGICPPSWHVPSDKEWNQLEAVFAASTTEYTNSTATLFTWEASYNITADWHPNSDNVFGHGKSMKSTCPPVGSSTASNGDSKTAAAGGFNLLLAGISVGGSATIIYGDRTHFWSSSSSNISGFAWFRLVNNVNAGMLRSYSLRSSQWSVRCKKN